MKTPTPTPSLVPAAAAARRPVRVLSAAAADAFLTSCWPSLYREDRDATPYQSREWLCGWRAQLPSGTEPLLLVCDGPAGPVAALALMREAEGGKILPLGSPVAECIQPVGRAAQDPSIAAALAQQLRAFARRAAVRIPDLPAGSMLSRQLATSGWERETLPYARVALPPVYAAMPTEVRRAHSKRQRRWAELEQRYRVRYRRSRGPHELLADFEALVGLHRRRWGQEPAQARQLRAVVAGCASTSAFIARLVVEDRVVAAQLCLHRRHRAYSLLTAMTNDPVICRAGPGHALLRLLMQELHEDGFASLDLGRTRQEQASYKDAYQPRWSQTATYDAPPPAAARGG